MSLQQSRIYLNDTEFIPHYFLCNYIPIKTGQDKLSKSLIRFKNAMADDLQAWIDCAVKELNNLSLPNDLIILRALSSVETLANNKNETALDKLGKLIAKNNHAYWLPHLIRKKLPTRPLKLLSAVERKKELKNVYSLNKKLKTIHSKKFLLIDDIVTTGTTMLAISNLLLVHFPDIEIIVFTLAKTAHEDELNSLLNLKGNTYNWLHDQANWMVADAEENYLSYDQLINFILKDKFE